MPLPNLTSASPDDTGRILRAAVFSRLLVLGLSFLWRSLLHPYDTSAGLNPPCLRKATIIPPLGTAAAAAAEAAVERGVVWDGVYFVRIAECGDYEYEQSYAFLPLLPVILRTLARSILAPLIPTLGCRSAIVISGYVLNNLAFVVAAVYFYRLSLLILKDRGAALRASMLFCFNPASVFYSSIYSESLYALCSLGGQYYLFSGCSSIAVVLLALSGAARSNGALNAGYFCFLALLQAYDAIVQKRTTNVLKALLTGLACSICIFVPFLAFQLYGYYNICLNSTVDELRPWCKAKIPLIYGFIQSHYWGVGFLKYFQVKQLPNFLLASPILSLAIWAIVDYACSFPQVVGSIFDGNSIAPLPHTHGNARTSIGETSLDNNFKNSEGNLMLRRRKMAFDQSRANKSNCDASRQTTDGYHSIMVLPFVIHLAFLTFTACFVMHVQVATRFLSASPPVYWYASYVLVSRGKAYRRSSYLIWVYFGAYILLGSLLFSNFYPFT